MASGRLLSRDGRGLKERLKDFAKGSDNFSRMGSIATGKSAAEAKRNALAKEKAKAVKREQDKHEALLEKRKRNGERAATKQRRRK